MPYNLFRVIEVITIIVLMIGITTLIVWLFDKLGVFDDWSLD